MIWAFDRYELEAEYANISMDACKRNFSGGWEWDEDQLYMNFWLHPIMGGLYFNTARSNGFTFYQSIPFTFGGSLIWEYLGEKDRPSANDMINTTFTGVLVGEIMFRLSSNILDDRAVGLDRAVRELGAAVVNPVRGMNRLMTGSVTKGDPTETYHKEPIQITASAGTRMANEGASFGTGKKNLMVDVNLEYGDPFRSRPREPFGYFTFWGNLNFGDGYKLTDNVVARGLLYGTNHSYGDLEMLTGIFQYFDYWDNWTFELATLAFGGGVVTKLPLGENKRLLTNFHIAAVPLAGNDTRLGPTTSDSRDYNYGDGLQAELDGTLAMGRWNLATIGYYYWVHSYAGEDNLIGIYKPRISYDLNDFLSVGFEQLFYVSDRYPADAAKISIERTEQKLYISYYFRDPSLDK